MQVPSSGHHGEMRIKGLVATPSRSQTSGDPWSLSREMWERHAPALTSDKELSVSALGCMCQLSPRQRSNNQDYARRKGNVEPAVWRSHFIFLTPGLYLPREISAEGEPDIADRSQAPRPQGCRGAG